METGAAQGNPENENVIDKPNQDLEIKVNPAEEILIPKAMQPYINKEINFDVFLEILTERVDKLRVAID